MKILYFAPIYYDDMKQRPQQIAELLSEKHIIYYVEPTISFIRQLLKGGKSCSGEKRAINKNLKIIRLNGYFTFHKSIEIVDLFGINNIWELFQLKKLIKDCDVIWVGYSGWYTLVRHIKNKPILFDKMDEEDMLVSSWMLKKTLKRNKQKMLKISNVIIVTCKKFYDDLNKCGKPVYLIPNGVSNNFMGNIQNSKIEYNAIEKVKIFGYIGTIGKWFDMQIIDKILEISEDYRIILVGKNYLPENKTPKIKYLGVKKNEELSEIIQKFDVCLYNFKKSDLLDTINPVKIYEYLSVNKPVLAVKSIETEQLGKYLQIYDNEEEIRKILSHKIKRPFKNEFERETFVRENSWEARVKEINNILDLLKKIDFDKVSYN